MTKHDTTSTDASAPSRPIKISKSYGSSSAINTKGNVLAVSKRKSEDENGLDVEENGVRLKVKLFFYLIVY